MITRLLNYFYLLQDKVDEWMWSRICRSRTHSIILMYHELTTNTLNIKKSCLHNIDEFINTIEQLKREGYDFVSLDQAIIPPPKGSKSAAITFDDVHSSVYYLAYPILKEKKIPFTLFVAIEMMGKDGMVDERQLKEMANNPLCTVGAHTMSHCMLRKVRNSWEEMEQSKKQLEILLGKNVDYLAYPYGKHSSVSIRVMRQAKRIGFKRAFGTIDAPINKITQHFKYYLPRIVIHK